MTALLCMALTLSSCARGGAAIPLPPRGGQAAAVIQPVEHLAEWSCIHRHEGAWNDTADPYWGGLQMDRGFMDYYGADMEARYDGYADKWPPREQMIVAERAYDGWRDTPPRGFTPWPNTARACGVL